MTQYNVYQDIAERTQGDVYIGVVGPVRTGKSTFIKKFMELLVLPGIENDYKRARATDELPQSAGGRTIMTTEPKFIPNEAVEISVGDSASFNIRMIDCVGYIVNGALGHIEGEMPRMVQSPWAENPVPFEIAAEMGTQKVITDHSTIGVVVTSDGSICEIGREDYIPAEERVIAELKEINKPFVVVLNSAEPESERTNSLKCMLEEKYGVKVIPLNCMHLSKVDIDKIMQCILYEFPISSVSFFIPEWITALGDDNELKQNMQNAVLNTFGDASKIADILALPSALMEYDFIEKADITSILAGQGAIEIRICEKEDLFFETIRNQTGFSVEDKGKLLNLLCEMLDIKKKYEKVAAALEQVNQVGYGIVTPDAAELTLEEPEIVKQGSRFGVRLRASAPSIHIMCNKPKFLKIA